MHSYAPFEAYRLPPLDHLAPHLYMTCSASFPLQDTAKGISALEEGVHHLVNNFPFLSGNIVSTNPAGKVNVREVRPSNAQRLNACPMLSKKAHPQSISCLRDPEFSHDNFSALPNVLKDDYNPLIRFQANEMRDGIILTTFFSHAAIDAVGFSNILSALASFCQSRPNPALLSSSKEQERARRRIHAIEQGIMAVSNEKGYGSNFELSSKCTGRKLVFQTTKLEHLREMCQNYHEWISDQNSEAEPVSLNDVASGIIWLCVVRARAKANGPSFSTTQPSFMAMARDIRLMLGGLIPRDYLGNALVFPSTSYPVSAMLEKASSIFGPVIDLAFRAQKTRKSVDDDHVRSIIGHVQASHDWGSFGLKLPEVGFSNLRHTNFYGMNFGPNLGYMDRFEVSAPQAAGLCWFLPARTAKEGPSSPWELCLVLEEDAWAYLEADPLIQWVSGEASQYICEFMAVHKGEKAKRAKFSPPPDPPYVDFPLCAVCQCDFVANTPYGYRLYDCKPSQDAPYGYWLYDYNPSPGLYPATDVENMIFWDVSERWTLYRMSTVTYLDPSHI
ncbi:hypothetical protein P170DRAFT_494142 [Aspergillus steynii IBT 23096]|uniref:Transferase family protein n=1 Tax=Aspergillus steynii IBT 23096 TaxID=1392250 RepID=A0A2I2G755_9EURO|nr:uncharacterized protein P170DRAFT_494142 [Aspergillus steynii IBT 23096]PLB48719.1 hypothetical protein P170DRAFT_494142 [Aspergillus steynii IBT 23096]